MTPEQLREACVEAGLELVSHGLGPMVNTGYSAEFMENPMLPAYVAELLLAKMRTSGLELQQAFYYELCRIDETHQCDTGTAEQRITAAMRALGHEGFGND